MKNLQYHPPCHHYYYDYYYYMDYYNSQYFRLPVVVSDQTVHYSTLRLLQ